MFMMQTDLTGACGDNPTGVCRWLYELTGNAFIADLGDWVVARPLRVIVIFLVAFVLNRLVRRAIRKMTERLISQQEAKQPIDLDDLVPDGLPRDAADRRFSALRQRAREKAAFLQVQRERSKQRAQSLGAVLRSLSSIVIYAMAIIIALGEFGVSLGPLVAGAGIVGVAVGFGAQSLVRDFFSGIFMLIEDQYGVGDNVDVGEAAGIVEAVNLRTTRLRDVSGTVWHIPNGEIRRVGNRSQQWARTVLDIDVAYDTDIAHASTVIKEVADGVWRDALEHATVIEEPEILGVEAFRDNAISIRLVLKVEPGEQFATAREVRTRLKPAFDAAGIEIPFPQRTVWLHQQQADRDPPGTQQV